MKGKKRWKRNTGIILIIIQLMAIYGCTLEGNSLPTSVFEWLGFLIVGIIGSILLIKYYMD